MAEADAAVEGQNTDLSDGEVVDEAPAAASEGKDEPELDEGPKAKKRKLESGEDEGWETVPTKKQRKKMVKNRKREKKIHQDIEDKYAANANQLADSTYLKDEQAEVIAYLLRIVSGKQPNRAVVPKIKTLQFQGVVSSLVTGSPQLKEPLKESAAELSSDHKVVVLWMSMVSSDFFRNHANHFAKVKKLSPCVMFDIEHPGSSKFVKLGLENFMVLTNNENATHVVPEVPKPVITKPRWDYLFTMDELTDHDFPNPSKQGGVDQLGRDIGSYCSLLDWPEGDINDTPQVSAARQDEDKIMPLFAVDCEMVETRLGSELARISIVNEALECIYNTYVKPECPVVDYRTKYSGLSEEILEDVTTTLQDVQTSLPSLLPSNSILVGHSLENDFHAMRFKHPFVVDTSMIFTPLATPTSKPSLRRLCKELLCEEIQNKSQGHDSIEDATTCMKLMQLKLEKGDSCKVAFNEITPSIFTDYRTRGSTTGIVDKDTVIRLFGRGSNISVEVKTDVEAVSRSSEVISNSKFTFIQLHSMEYLLKSEHGRDLDKIEAVAQEMDSQVCEVVGRCPPKTVVFVVCGSSDIRRVRKIQQEDIPNQHQLKREVMLARTGCVVGLVIN
jgi:DNA polymerase III epsilon subunit-like protein